MISTAEIAQLGERQTEDLKVPGSTPGFGKVFLAKLEPCFKIMKENSFRSWSQI